jgi:peptidoglycan hydrolase CwlO-like protein
LPKSSKQCVDEDSTSAFNESAGFHSNLKRTNAMTKSEIQKKIDAIKNKRESLQLKVDGMYEKIEELEEKKQDAECRLAGMDSEIEELEEQLK